MDSRTGKLYDTAEAAIADGAAAEDIVEITGSPHAIERVAGRVRMASLLLARRRKAKRQQQKAGRRANRR